MLLVTRIWDLRPAQLPFLFPEARRGRKVKDVKATAVVFIAKQSVASRQC